MRLSVVVPVYNAAEFIEPSVNGLRDYLDGCLASYEILLVNDGSTDDSVERARRLESERVRVLSFAENRGKFAALRDGMLAARGSCRIFTDADIPYEHAALPYMERLVNERQYHVVIGDRTLPGSQYGEKLPPLRRAATSVFSHVIRLFFTGGLADTQCGLKGFRSDVAEAIFPLLREKGFAGDVELLYIALKYNLEIRRIPMRLQRAGRSTVHAYRHGLVMLRALARLRGRWKNGAYASDTLAALARQCYWEGT
jgi:dolichyl-phosphate beta-glucosyltransferase